MADGEKPKGEYGAASEAGYADPGYQADKKPRYPLKVNGKLDEDRIRAAWNYISQADNAAKYSSDDLQKVKDRIIAAWKDVIDPEGPPSARELDGQMWLLGVSSEELTERAAFAQPRTVRESDRSVEVIAATSEPVLMPVRGGDFRWEILDMSPGAADLSRLNGGSAPLLDRHVQANGAVLGVVSDARIENGALLARVAFGQHAEALEIWNRVKAGTIRNVSIGYRILATQKVGTAKDGRPVVKVTKWEAYEVSIVPVAADSAAKTRGIMPHTEEPAMADENKIEAEKQERELAEKVAVETKRAAEDAVAKERARISEIRAICGVCKCDAEREAQYVKDNLTPDAVRKLLFDEWAGEQQSDGGVHTPVTAGADQIDKFRAGCEAWLYERCGVADDMERAGKVCRELRGVKVDGGEFRGLRSLDIAREYLELIGVSTRRLSSHQIAERAFTTRVGGQTTSDFAVLFENVIGKILLGAYALAPMTWQNFCARVPVSSLLHGSPRYRVGSLGVLESVNEAGEFRQVSLQDGVKFTITAGEKGKILGLTREVIIEDNLGYVTSIAQMLGRAAARTIENDVYALLLANSGLGPTQSDSQPFFHANRSNVNATGAAISVAALDADRVIMRRQMDPNAEDYLDLMPYVLLVAPELETSARLLNEAQYDPVDNKFQKMNTARGMFPGGVVSSPLLSGKRRYLFANPADVAAVAVAFLEGYPQGPVLSSQDGWRTDGVEWRVLQFAKAQMFDPKGAVTNAGE